MRLTNWASTILSLLGEAAILSKAGYSGWNALVPFYGSYLFFKVAGVKKLFGLYCAAVIGIFVCLLGVYASGSDSLFPVLIILAIALVIIHIFRSIGLAASFELSGGYVLGLILVPVIFYLIIGFSDNIRYYGPGSSTDYSEQNGNDYSEQYNSKNDYSERYNSKNDFYDRDF